MLRYLHAILESSSGARLPVRLDADKHPNLTHLAAMLLNQRAITVDLTFVYYRERAAPRRGMLVALCPVEGPKHARRARRAPRNGWPLFTLWCAMDGAEFLDDLDVAELPPAHTRSPRAWLEFPDGQPLPPGP